MAKVTPANMQTAQVLPPTGWEASFLQSVGAPVNANSEQFLDDWYVAEHGSSGYSGGSNGGLNNAFDTALPGPGSVSMAYGPAAAVVNSSGRGPFITTTASPILRVSPFRPATSFK